MRARRDPILLLRFALREGDDRLADQLLLRLREHSGLAARADAELMRVPRGRPSHHHPLPPGLADGPGGA